MVFFWYQIITIILLSKARCLENKGAILDNGKKKGGKVWNTKYKRNSALYIKLQIYKWNIPYPFKKVPQPTTKKKKMRAPLRRCFHHFPLSPPLIQKRRAYQVSFDNSSPLLGTWQDMKGLLAFFRALTSIPVLTKAKRKGKKQELWHLTLIAIWTEGTTKFVGVEKDI